MNNNLHGKVFTVREFASIMNKAVYSMVKFKSELRLINKNFESHIMLAVSEVNGCRICSYYHTKGALKSGSTEEEISQFLTGDLSSVDKTEAVALIFAQHYADCEGDYNIESYERVIQAYGIDKAYGILGTIRIIMMGNVYGITYGYFKDRLQRDRNKNSKLYRELVLILSPIFLIPLTFIKNIFVSKYKYLK